jgi:pentalenene oxygenase
MEDVMAIPSAPHAVPLLGHIPQLAHHPLRFLESLSQYGELVGIRLGKQRAVVICDPGLMTEVLRNDEIFDKGGPFGDRMREIVGNSVFTCLHGEHRRRRRLVQPAFQKSRFPGYADLMIREVDSVISGWQDGSVLDVRTEMTNLTSSVLTTTIYPDLAPAMSRQLIDDVLTVMESVFPRVIQPKFLDRFPTRLNRSFNTANRRLHDTIRRLVIEQHTSAVDMGDLLSGVLSAHEEGTLSDAEIVDDLVAFTIAGIETAADLLSWTLHRLAEQPVLQQQIYEELVALEEPLNYSTSLKLEQIRNTLWESLRWRSPAWFVTRMVARDTELAGHPISAGTVMVWSPHLVHHHANVYLEPERFEPDRWNHADPPSGSFIPFGMGPRKCMGDNLGTLEATLALAMICQRWEVSPAGKQVRTIAGATLYPGHLRLRITRRAQTMGSPPNVPARADTAIGQ